MLTSLKIKNFALVENAEVEFSPGLNVISGESGSGKSILIGALAVLLGSSGSKDCIRDGEKRCEIEAVLSANSDIAQKVAEFCSLYDIENCGSELVLRRVILENSARNHVNGTLIPLKAMKSLAELFFDFNRPDDELSLNSQVRQLELLDRFGALDTAPYQNSFNKLESLRCELAEFDRSLPNQTALDEARELVAEMDRYNFEEDEEEELTRRFKILSNSRELINSSVRASQILSGEENSITDIFGTLMREFYAMDKLADGALAKIIDEAQELNGALSSLQNSLDTFASDLELDGESLQETENRLDALYRLKRRYGPSVQELFEHYQAAKEALRLADDSIERRNKIADDIALAEKEMQLYADELTCARKKAAVELEKKLLQELESLGFKKCRFEWSFIKTAPTLSGMDELDILFSANSGERVLPLRKIASSGERSRLFLAIKNVLASADDIPVVIFDEIDANIGGETANKVGASLRELGKFRQIITISHLAQIAGSADSHWQVRKYVREDGRTVSEVKLSEGEARVKELARMLGNADGAMDYARNLLVK